MFPPAVITVAFDPPARHPDNVVFCRVNVDPIFDDPDDDIVRCTFVWRLNGSIIRQVTSASCADAIPRDAAGVGQTLRCTVTPADVALFVSVWFAALSGGC